MTDLHQCLVVQVLLTCIAVACGIDIDIAVDMNVNVNVNMDNGIRTDAGAGT